MYLQLEKGESIRLCDIVGIFDIETATVSSASRVFLAEMQDKKAVVSLCSDIPKSMVLCDTELADSVYLSGLSAESIERRTKNTWG